ncbi:succinate-semialdehyde dehydrogenase / glutarate-semialdehyde dehydrogenase [Cyclonatronum proteinivorum]|uniref:Succinate-semialdehyde dehydrogenase / glutarate-semialdehyde dehydrogenase n=1 Tax=Cyclonatronum proteinivorum TaxID=1457365 RepID=A0A345UGU2_9BACT|nr:NAD-dependent succinate-semialdehyde dehydrogenase [Cyclonatronum proteinivorum]AXI99693.1 succinate-semialdehyde dehydrogenase / glutarate-semialdehyde dehydrogenase [Cyclonatronum proteinivorum]
MAFQAVNPATGERSQEYPLHTDAEIESTIEAGQAAWQQWKNEEPENRAACLLKLADLLESDKEKLARLMCDEMGKVLKEGLAEAEKCAWVCRFYAENGASFLKPEPIETEAGSSYVTYRPLGLLFAVMPWNFPLWQVFRFGAPSLMAGNTILLKHAENVPGCADAIVRLIDEAGFPTGALASLRVTHDVAAAIIADDRISGVTLTGSTRAGRNVAEVAARNLKKTVLELGGSDPYLILEDAPLGQTVEACVTSRMLNAGQSCIAAKRFIVTDKIYEAFTRAFTEALQKKVMGDPRHESTDFGPMARADLRDTLHKQVESSLQKGAQLLLGGQVPPGAGAYYPATVLTDVTPGMPAFDEELFGPVAAIIRAKDTDEAVRLANQTRYGLGAAVFTADTAFGEKLAAESLEAGSCFVNDFVRSDPRLPFGGIRESGFGRELARWGMHEFVNVKTVYVKQR